jgi:CRISPR-associated endonuclease Cas1 subtype II
MTTSGFRELIVANRAILTYKNNWLVVRSAEGATKIFMDELEVVIIENPSCSITAYCVVEMAKRNIKLIFCDEKHNPASEALPLYGSYDCAAKLASQIAWSPGIKDAVWQRIIQLKIEHQAGVLSKLGCNEAAAHLLTEVPDIKLGDSTNREGMAARIYFNALFGLDFNRKRGGRSDVTNAALNYGYVLLTSLFNRSVVAAGYSTQLGIFHRGSENQFNLSCDLMEPFRSIIDLEVVSGDYLKLDLPEKHRLANMIFVEVDINGAIQTLDNAVPIYLRSVFEALDSGDVEAILDYEL